jgi:hypothetical protein
MLANLIGCSKYGVKGQIAKQGIAFSSREKWTPEEIQYVENHYTEMSVKQMAKHLHRSINAVKIKTTRKHLSLRLRVGWYDKMDVCEMLGVDHHKVQAWIDSGDLKARWHDPDRKPQAKGMAMWHIEADDLKYFIVTHSVELQGRNIDLFSVLDLCGVIPIKIA